MLQGGKNCCGSNKDIAAGRRKDLSLFVQSCCLGALIRGLENLETPGREGFFVILFVPNKKYVKVFKGFNWVCGLILGLQNLDSFFWERI